MLAVMPVLTTPCNRWEETSSVEIITNGQTFNLLARPYSQDVIQR